MDNNLFIVSFIRQGNLPNEDYYYQRKEDAEYHFSLFKNDDSGLYQRILLVEQGKKENYLDTIIF